MIPQIAIIVPCYNQGKFLQEALDSVLSQSLQEWELVIVDDGSSDNSATVAKSYVAKDSRIRYVYQENAGPSAARNKGVRLTSAPLIFFLDGDNLIHRELLSRGVMYMKSHNDCTLYYSRAQYFGTRDGEFVLNYTSYRDLLVSNSIDCACIVRREDFLRIGGFDEQMRGYEDWEFFIRLLYHNDRIFQDTKILFSYRVNDGQMSVNTQAKKRNDELTMYIYHKHADKYKEYYGTPFRIVQKCNWLDKELDGLLHSRSYRLGRMLLNPFSLVKKLLH